MSLSVKSALVSAALMLSFVAADAQESAAPAVPEDRVAVLSYTIVDGVSAPMLSAAGPGDAERGEALFFDPERGKCASCHWVSGMDGAPNALAGPPLSDVGARLASGVIRLWIINPRAFKADAAMPAYYSLTPEKERTPGDAPDGGSPILAAQEIEDLVAYLERLATAAPAAAQE